MYGKAALTACGIVLTAAVAYVGLAAIAVNDFRKTVGLDPTEDE